MVDSRVGSGLTYVLPPPFVRALAADVRTRVEALPTDPVLGPEEWEELAAELERLEGVLGKAREVLGAAPARY